MRASMPADAKKSHCFHTVCTRVCLNKSARAVNDKVTCVSQNPDPIRPCSAKKICECRLADIGREIHNPQIAGLVKKRNSGKKD